ncbi:MAG: DUF5829 family protein [Bacteroidota bacterium]
MFVRYTLFVLIGTLLMACQENLPKEHDPSLIEREKIDAAFDHDVSRVLFDHLYIVVDSLTYRALTHDSSWKNDYAFLDKGLPDFDPHISGSSTCYMRGLHHYIEILGPKNSYNEPVGKSGIGFSLENDNEHFHLGMTPKLRGTDTSFLGSSETVSMPVGESEQTWFKAFYTPSPGTALHTWYAFYNPSFLDDLHNQAHARYTREAFLKNTYKDDKLFNGVHEINLQCTLQDYQRIAQEMRHLGRRLLDKNGDKLTIESGDITITLKPSENIEYSRIVSLRCKLNALDTSITHLGHITITNEGLESLWEFGELYNN